MSNSQFERDLGNLGLLAEEVIAQVEISLDGLPASQKNAYRGALAGAMMQIIAQAYIADRERYAKPTPPSPPTPVPDPHI